MLLAELHCQLKCTALPPGETVFCPLTCPLGYSATGYNTIHHLVTFGFGPSLYTICCQEGQTNQSSWQASVTIVGVTGLFTGRRGEAMGPEDGCQVVSAEIPDTLSKNVPPRNMQTRPEAC